MGGGAALRRTSIRSGGADDDLVEGFGFADDGRHIVLSPRPRRDYGAVVGRTCEIGSELYVSLKTVKTHTRTIFRKLGASSREDAVERAREAGLV
jgi:hypothetical protein